MPNYSILVLTYKIRHALQAEDAFNLDCLVCGSLGRVARVTGTDVKLWIFYSSARGFVACTSTRIILKLGLEVGVVPSTLIATVLVNAANAFLALKLTILYDRSRVPTRSDTHFVT